MALSTKIIKTRIRSIGNTKKITKAMEMVSAAKMRKAVNAVLASRDYANSAWEMVISLASKVQSENHPLLQPHQTTEKSATILISANKGLCGGFNSHILNQAIEYSKAEKANGAKLVSWLVMGKKGGEALALQKAEIEGDFEKPDVVTGAADILDLARIAIDGYIKGKYDKVSVVYTDFISPLRQEPRVRQLLPITPLADRELGVAFEHGPEAEGAKVEKQTAKDFGEYIFEPNMDQVLNQFLPRLVEIQLYQALLESTASEHSARMVAMKNANEAANDMIDELTLIFNQARQASITREIAEISGGKAAIENG